MSEKNIVENKGRFQAPWASGENLRKVEKNVLIPNIMKAKAKVLCKEYMDGFFNCASGRSLSLMWSCKKERDTMQACLQEKLDDPKLEEESRKEYLVQRDAFQKEYVETGHRKKMQKKDSVI